jgi:hypothetical protein
MTTLKTLEALKEQLIIELMDYPTFKGDYWDITEYPPYPILDYWLEKNNLQGKYYDSHIKLLFRDFYYSGRISVYYTKEDAVDCLVSIAKDDEKDFLEELGLEDLPVKTK